VKGLKIINKRSKNNKIIKILTWIILNVHYALNQRVLNNKMHFINTFLLSILTVVQLAKLNKMKLKNFLIIYCKMMNVEIFYQIQKAGNQK
jgi:hypothetical protein